MLRDDIREVISPFKCTILDDLLSRARVREADLQRKKNKEAKETKRKLKFRDRDAKKPKQDHSRKSHGTQIKTPCKKFHKAHLGECRANLLKEKMVDEHHKEVLKASTSKGVESPTNDADHDDNENGSSSSSEDLNLRGFTDEERKLEEFRKRGIINDYRNKMATYHDFMACEVQKFDETLDLIASTRWLFAVEGALCTSSCKEKSKVNFASNFLRDSAKMWWDEKICEQGEEWIGSCTWKEFKELFNA
ncbi:hypothetical protein Tco_0017240 [Tanacetum coccineum]